MRESAERDFWSHKGSLETVTSLKYRGRVLTVADDNWLAVVGNLNEAQKVWERILRILGQEGSNPRVSGVFF